MRRCVHSLSGLLQQIGVIQLGHRMEEADRNPALLPELDPVEILSGLAAAMRILMPEAEREASSRGSDAA